MGTDSVVQVPRQELEELGQLLQDAPWIGWSADRAYKLVNDWLHK